MATSQNGYIANDRSVIASFTVPGVTGTRFYWREGDLGFVFAEFTRRWNLEVEHLDSTVLDDWSYAERPIRGSETVLSNHASGTATDYNAAKHPLGRTGTYTAAQVAAIRKLLADFRGCFRWGGDYTGRKDEMHAEANEGWDAFHAMADVIRSLQAPFNTPPIPAPVDPASTVVGRIGEKYRAMGGTKSFLGLPLSQELASPDGHGRFVVFANGNIYWVNDDIGAHEVHGDILAVGWKALGYEVGVYGYPTSDEMDCTLLPERHARWQTFQGGNIWWSPETGAHGVYGDMLPAYASYGFERDLGFPTTEEVDGTAAGTRVQHFEHGTLTWTASTRLVVRT